MTLSFSSRFGVAGIGFVVSTVLCTVGQELLAQPNAPAVIAMAARSGNIPLLTLQQPAALHVGGVLDNPDNEFNHKNFFITATMLSTGGLAVADGFRLRFYDKYSKQTAVLGKVAGAGPNEFNSLWRICTTRGDTLIAHDSRNARVSVFTAAGQLVIADPATRDIIVRDIDGAVIRSYRLQEQTRTVSAKVAENSTICAAQGFKWSRQVPLPDRRPTFRGHCIGDSKSTRIAICGCRT